MYIYNEIPVGIIDWVNKIFTLANDIGSIEEIYLGGAAYRDFTFVGNVITLVDAPLTGMTIGVDYFTAELEAPVVKRLDEILCVMEKRSKDQLEMKMEILKDKIKKVLSVLLSFLRHKKNS